MWFSLNLSWLVFTKLLDSVGYCLLLILEYAQLLFLQYFASFTLSPPPTPITYVKPYECVQHISCIFSHFLCFQIDFLSEIEWGFLFDFWSFVFVFSNLASLSSHLSSHLLHVKSGQVDFFTFKISTYDLLLIPILWWNYASSHLFSIFFLYFLIHLPDILKCFFFPSPSNIWFT